jgi:[acyl-carrier-protein] S-malonyltransferase
MELAKAKGARLVKELVVSGAFHSPLMQSAKDRFHGALASALIHDAAIPVYANVTAKPVQKAAEIRQLLEQQLTSAVRWDDAIRAMSADGATTFVEIGPGKVLQGLVKRIVPAADVKGFDKFADVENTTAS